MENKFIFLYDGGCPLCLRETNFLKERDKLNKINFIDINDEKFDPKHFSDISYRDAMSTLHGILENGEIIRGLEVLSYAYQLTGLGWVYFPLRIKFLSGLLKLIYKYWAKYRLLITGRQNIEKICINKCKQ